MGKNNLLQSMILVLLAISGPSWAGKTILLAEFGRMSVDVGSEYTFENEEEANEDLLGGFMAGYKFDNNAIVAFNYTYATGLASDGLFGAFDHYDLSEQTLLVGYSFDVARYLRIVPMAGWTRWSLTGEEGAFLNPGEEEELSEDGRSFVPRINFEIPFGELIQANIAYQRGNYDFGDASSWRVGLKFEF